MGRIVVFIVGKDPLEEIGGGHSAYVRAHALAAIRAGFAPHLFCASGNSGTVKSPFGVVHRIRSLWPLRPRVGLGFRGYLPLVLVHVPQIAALVERFLLASRGPHLLHGFGVWGCVGVTVTRRLGRKSIEVVPILNSYTTIGHESRGRVQGLSAAHRLRQRIYFRTEDIWMRHVIDRYERRAHVESRLVLVNYESVRRLILARWDLGAKCRKIPYTSESAFRQEGAQRPTAPPEAITRLRPVNAPLIVAVSRHDPRKGVDVLLHALAQLRRAGRRFRACLVGGGPLLEAHRQLADRLGLKDETAIEGFVSDSYRYLQHADVFVLPSLQEGSGSLSLIEALQAGLPIVASSCDGIPEDVEDGQSALLVPPGDMAKLCQALERLLGDHALRRMLAEEARAVFLHKFCPTAFADALREIYAEFGLFP